MVLAGIALRREGGVNFEAGGGFQRWMLWSVIFLTLPQLLSWLAAQGIVLPLQSGNINSPWVISVETSFNNFVSDILVARLVPIFAAFFVLKAALDAAQGQNPLGSIVTAIFLLAASGTVTLELALSGVPMVVAYRLDAIARLIKPLIRFQMRPPVPSIVLANLVLREMMVPEFIDGEASPEALAAARRMYELR